MDFHPYSRREFLRLTSLVLAGLGLASTGVSAKSNPFAVGRVTVGLIYIYKTPSFGAERLGERTRDQLLNLLEEVQSPNGPSYNPLWYRIAEGYVHSGYIQRSDFHPPNPPLTSIPENGVWAQVTVPYTRTFYRGRSTAWSPLYRLYYESVHWVKGVIESPDGQVWYRISDPKNASEYYAQAADLRPLAFEEYSPIAQDVPAEDKHIVVSIEEQTLIAYEGDKVVLSTKIASGLPSKEVIPGDIPTDTPIGYWRISQKMPSRHMGNGALTNEIDAYELPGVPWMMGFHETGASLHGSFWHNNFGRRMSHGCVNMRNDEALWLFRWTTPVYDPSSWYTNGLGTLIQVK